MSKAELTRKLEKWCEQKENGKAYYRPFLCDGDPAKATIFLAGINPATAFYPKDKTLKEYVELLGDYEAFMREYEKIRKARSDSRRSPTRAKMNKLIDFLKGKSGGQVVLETDVVAYPTENAKLLKSEPDHIKKRGREIFIEVLEYIKPKLLILYGKKAIEYLLSSLEERKALEYKPEIKKSDLKQEKVADLELRNPLFTIKFGNDQKCAVFVLRHFVAPGFGGESYEKFKKELARYIEKAF
jgi:hypothetical protein